MSEIQLVEMMSNQLPEAAQMLAHAFVTNPINIAALGPDRLDRNQAFLRIGLGMMQGRKMVAVDGSRIVGVLHYVDSPRCEFSALQKLGLLPKMLIHFGPGATVRVASWLGAWDKHHPKEPHCHLGPIGVLPEYQGRGIGRLLMETYCGHLDSSKLPGYLETDRPGNVKFYERFRFKVTREIDVIGVKNYLMWRNLTQNAKS